MKCRGNADARWLLRHGVFERFVGVIVTIMYLGLWFVLVAFAEPWALIVLVLAGLFMSALRRRGVAVPGSFLEMHTIVSCTRVPVQEITRIHIAPLMSSLCVETKRASYDYGNRSHVKDSIVAGFREETLRLGEELDIEVIQHDSVRAYVDAAQHSKLPGWDLRGFLSTFKWPEVYLTVGIGSILTLAAVPL